MERLLQHLAGLDDELFYVDTALALHAANEQVSSPSLSRQLARAMTIARGDHDHPIHRLWDPHHPVDMATMRAKTPLPFDAPISSRYRAVTRMMMEAITCEEAPVSAKVLRFLREEMHDDGGYLATHAAWILMELQRRGCLPITAVRSLRSSYLKELATAVRARDDAPVTISEADLFAEQLLALMWLDGPPALIEKKMALYLGGQQENGAVGISVPNQNTRIPVHAAVVGIWALATFQTWSAPPSDAAPHDG